MSDGMSDAWLLLTDPNTWPALAAAWLLSVVVLVLTWLTERRHR